MKNLIKIIASLTALTLMTACGGLTLPELDLDLTGCQANVFRTNCGKEFEAARNRVITECRTTFDTTGAVASQDCINAAEFVCNATPFDPLCVDEEYVTIRTNTIKGCNAGTEEADICDRAVVAVCGANPYDRFCLEEEDYNDDRATIQNNCNSSNPACTETTLNNYCTTNPFRGVCATPEYNQARSDLSRDCSTGGIGDPRCLTSTVNGVCRFDPFDSVCDERYNNTRRNFCLNENTSTRCVATVERICTANEYDDICTGTTYADSRSATASRDAYETRNCPNLPGNGDCEQLLRFLCTDTPLDTYCDERGQYRSARVALCLADDNRADDDNPCATTISQVCPSKPLDDLCAGIALYAPLQESSCNGESATSKPECATTLTRICGNLAGTSADGDPFSLTCRNAAFKPARDAIALACVSENSGRLCATELNYVCRNTPFNDRCKGVETALPHQISACISGTETDNCANAEFFTDATIRNCLVDPFSNACVNDPVFGNYVSEDVRCVLDNARAGCANPTAVFGTTLPTRPTQVLTNPLDPFHATTNPYTDGVFADPTQPYDASTNRYVGGFIRLDSTILNDSTGDLDRAKIEGISNFLPESIGLANPVTLRRNSGATDNSDSDDGIAYFYGFNDDDLALSYGGILPTTNLGAPLEVRPAVAGSNVTAIWDGHFRYRQTADIPLKVQKFYVDFTDGIINFADAAGTGPSKINASIFNQSTDMELHGTFGSNAVRRTFTYDTTQPNNVRETTTDLTLAPGELGGNLYLYYDVAGTNGNNDRDLDNIVRFNLPVHGLIGQEGVVGVFLDAGSRENSRSGGFTASNPDHPNNK